MAQTASSDGKPAYSSSPVSHDALHPFRRLILDVAHDEPLEVKSYFSTPMCQCSLIATGDFLVQAPTLARLLLVLAPNLQMDVSGDS